MFVFIAFVQLRLNQQFNGNNPLHDFITIFLDKYNNFPNKYSIPRAKNCENAYWCMCGLLKRDLST